MPAVGCIGYGPGDASIGFGNDSLFNTMAAGLGSVEGVYDEAPLKGMLVWNSHAFNVTDQPGKLDIWVNLDFCRSGGAALSAASASPRCSSSSGSRSAFAAQRGLRALRGAAERSTSSS